MPYVYTVPDDWCMDLFKRKYDTKKGIEDYIRSKGEVPAKDWCSTWELNQRRLKMTELSKEQAELAGLPSGKDTELVKDLKENYPKDLDEEALLVWQDPEIVGNEETPVKE